MIIKQLWLKTGTVHVAGCLGLTGRSGIIAKGARADFVHLNSNPLETVPFQDYIEGVVLGGMHYSRNRLDDMLYNVKSRIE